MSDRNAPWFAALGRALTKPRPRRLSDAQITDLLAAAREVEQDLTNYGWRSYALVRLRRALAACGYEVGEVE